MDDKIIYKYKKSSNDNKKLSNNSTKIQIPFTKEDILTKKRSIMKFHETIQKRDVPKLSTIVSRKISHWKKRELDTYYILLQDVNDLCNNINADTSELITISYMLGIDKIYNINNNMSKNTLCKILKNWLLLEYNEFKGVTYTYPIIYPNMMDIKNTGLVKYFDLNLPKTNLLDFETNIRGYKIFNSIFLIYLRDLYPELCLIPLLPENYFSIIYWDTVTLKLTVIDGFEEYLKKCLKNSTKSIIIIPITLFFRKGSHANVIFYYKKTKTIERYDPHGFSDYDIELDKELIKYFKKINIPLKEINTPILICPSYYNSNEGLQILQGREKIKSKNMPGGFCSIWTKWFIHLRLEYPNIPSNNLLDKAIEQFESDKTILTYFITGYSNWILNNVSKEVLNDVPHYMLSGLTFKEAPDVIKKSIRKKMLSDI